MDLEEFRKNAHLIVDWMADYLKSIENYPVRAQTKPGEVANQIPKEPPIHSEPMEKIFSDFTDKILPGVTHWQHPSFFAYFPANSSPPSVLAEMLTATIGAQCMLWQTSPAGTEMETSLIGWLRRMIGLSEGFHGVIQDSASSASLCALLTAREKATNWETNDNGMTAVRAPLVVYATQEAHSSTEKGAKIAGYGKENIRLVSTDNKHSMCPNSLQQMIDIDIQNGLIPSCVIATIGTTGVGAIDPIRTIGEICKNQNIFFHIDAAWGGSALILPENRWMADGVELADSFVFNPHKWLMTNFDCSAYFVKDPDALVRTLSIMPEYLKSREQGNVIDYRDWSIPLGRRFRALKLWFVIRYYGVSGLQSLIRMHIELACQAEKWVAETPDFEVVTPRSLALFNFRYRPKKIHDPSELNQLNERLLHSLNDDGHVYFSQNRVRNMFVIRWSIGQTNTKKEHVEMAWDLIQETARNLS